MTKVAILIDGGYFLKRLPVVRHSLDPHDATAVADELRHLVLSHLHQLNEHYGAPHPMQLLYRTFYYDARPYTQKAHTAVDRRPLDYARSEEARFRTALFNALYNVPKLAVRLGEVQRDRNRSWTLNAKPQQDLLNGRLQVGDLTDDDFSPALRQKGVDMRIGLDIASITLKRQAETIILVSGDADFVPAAKLARREGIQFILDPLWQNISDDLSEHIDGLRSGFPRPGRETRPSSTR